MSLRRSQNHAAFTLIELLVVIAIIAILTAILFPVFAKARDKSRQATCQSNLRQLGIGLNMYAQDHDETYPMSINYGSPVNSWDQQAISYLGFRVVNDNPNTMILRCPSDDIVRVWSNCANSYTANIRSYTMPAIANGDTLISGMYTKPCPTCYTTAYFDGRALADVPDVVGTILLAESHTNQNNFANNSGAYVSNPPAQGANRACAGTPATVAPPHAEGWDYLFADGHVKWLKPEMTINGPGKTGGTLTNPRGMWTRNPND